MKTILLSIALLFALVCQAGEVFEGSYVMKISGDGENISTQIWAKDGHMRMKLAGSEAPGEMIMRDGMETMIVVMPSQRMYMEMPLDLTDMPTIEGPDMEGAPDEIPFEKTDETREILGYTAHEFTFEANGEKMVIWATEDLGSMPYSRNPMMAGWAKAMSAVTGLESFFPLEITGNEKGKVAFRMTVEEIEEKELPDSLFTAPEGFRKMTMPSGMGGFMNK
ncbi:MAG: DUF4412 domain-containing protein [Oceanipulchritudo sp.]